MLQKKKVEKTGGECAEDASNVEVVLCTLLLTKGGGGGHGEEWVGATMNKRKGELESAQRLTVHHRADAGHKMIKFERRSCPKK